MSLPKNYLVDATIDKLGESFIDLYESKVGDDIREFLFMNIYEELIEPETGRQRNLREVRSYHYKNKFRKTKRNWFTSLKKSITKSPKTPKELMAEIKYIEDGIDKGFINLKESHGLNDISELIEERLKEIENWVNDDTKWLSDYRYIKDKTILQIKNALTYDSIMAVTDLVIEKFDGELASIVKEETDLLSQFPLPGKSGFAKFNTDSFTQELGSKNAIAVDEYSSGDISVTTLFGRELIENQKTVSISERDFEIFNYVLSKRDIEFVERQKIFVNIGDIVKNVYASKGKKEYQRVITRLNKLKDIGFKIVDNNGDVYIFDLFDHIKLMDNETRAEIKINEVMYQRYIDNHVIRIYNDKIKNFTYKISQSMVMILQYERFRHLSHLNEEVEYKKEEEHAYPYPYEFFTRRIRFKSRNKTENLRKIEGSLEEMVSNQVTVKSFRRSHDVFYITFYPVSKHEAEDLIEANNPKPLLKLQK